MPGGRTWVCDACSAPGRACIILPDIFYCLPCIGLSSLPTSMGEEVSEVGSEVTTALVPFV
eukprot:487488-Alexandrium_andersonii.AAC.1